MATQSMCLGVWLGVYISVYMNVRLFWVFVVVSVYRWVYKGVCGWYVVCMGVPFFPAICSALRLFSCSQILLGLSAQRQG